MIAITGKTNIGRRKANEDRVIADNKWQLGLVADGMGGAGSGDVASQIVAATVTEQIAEGIALTDAITAAHEAVLAAAAAGRGNAGMGSTVVACRFAGNDYEIAWIGDSRAYLWDGDTLQQLTRDHSKVEMLLAADHISQEEALAHPEKNIITRAMGIPWHSGEAVPSVSGTLAHGQQILLCSDGLNDAAGDVTVREILRNGDEGLLQTLIDAALEAGGADNISVVLCSADDAGPAPEAVVRPQAVAITDGEGWRHFPETGPAGTTTTDRKEIETTRIHRVQPGAVQQQPTAGSTTRQNDPAVQQNNSRMLPILLFAGLAIAAGYFLFLYFQ